MVKPQFNTHRYVGGVCRLKGQSIVECRLPGSEIGGILAVHAKAIPADSVCADGEVQYGGRVLIAVVYEDGDKKVCRAERGAEFFHKAEGALVSPACFAKTVLTAENVTWRREGSGLYISVIVGADIAVYGNKQVEYLSGGEGLICQNDTLSVCKTVCVSGETEGEDEFDADYVGDILLHSETAVVNRVSANAGQIDVEGEIALNICVLKGDDSVCSYERIVPFKMQVPSDEAFGHVSVGARVTLKSAHLTAGTDEEKGKSKIVFSYCLSADCFLYVQEEFTAVLDAFSLENEILLKREKGAGRYLTSLEKCTERVSGTALISPEISEEFFLQAAVLPKVEIVCKKGERGVEAEGAVLAEVIFCNADGVHRNASLTLPFLFPVATGGEDVEIDGIVCGLNLRRQKGGEIEAEATLKLSVRTYEMKEWDYVQECVEGEEIKEENAAFSVFMPLANETLWQVAKRLRCAPEELEKSNPNLKFPIKSDERIYVYRQLN